MHMQNKLYRTQFSHNVMTDSQPVPEQQPWNQKIMDFIKFPEKTIIPDKFELPDKRGFKLMDTKEE